MDIILSIIIGTITYFGFGYIVFEVILGKYTEQHTLSLKGFNKSDEESSMLFLVVSCAAYAALITFVLYNWKTSPGFFEGFFISGVIGTLVAIMANSYWYSTTYLYKNTKPLIADVIAVFVTVGAMGGVISLVL